MDEHTFLVNRERAVDYLCSLDKVLYNLHDCYVAQTLLKCGGVQCRILQKQYFFGGSNIDVTTL